METKKVSSGDSSLDDVLQGFLPGDNIVWQIDRLEDYSRFAEKFIQQGLKNGRRCVYVRFARHVPVLKRMKGLDLVHVDPSKGFDFFSTEVHRIIEKYGREVFYVFDNLSWLVAEWATDELLANFFKVTCPYLYELDTVAFFALTRDMHSHSTVASIRDTTQILVNVYRVDGNTYLHPLKVYNRYSPQMFLPHVSSSGKWDPIFNSGEAAALSIHDHKKILTKDTSTIAPWDSLYKKLSQYYEGCGTDTKLSPETFALKQELTRMILGNHPEFNKVADRYLTLEELLYIRERIIGSGSIGGKAAGMLLARSILLKDESDKDFSKILEPHDSFYIGSDVFFSFMVNNDLFPLRLQLSENAKLTKEKFEEIEKCFVKGKFSDEIIGYFRDMMDYFGQAPIIVRSSSLLEDSFGNAFAGKYRSEFCTNQGSPDERLEAFIYAVKLVYASALNPDALSYRRTHGLENTDEQMAILVQRVSGMPYKDYFFPNLAGVTFSRNLFTWSPRIDPNKGMIRLVFGLGTRAVDRVGKDHPRIIAVSHPELRPEVGLKIAKYSQWEVDMLDVKNNEFKTLPVSEILKDGDYPNLKLFVSTLKDGHLDDPLTGLIDTGNFVLTFNNLIRRTDFVKNIEEMLGIIEKAYGQPVDMEFTAFISSKEKVRINLLQCRPMKIPGIAGPVIIPDDMPKGNILFRSGKTINGGVLDDIRYIIYIDPREYAEIGEIDIKKSVGRVVGRLNERLRLKNARFMMMGPGRWGSNNLDLGVNVSYSDIDNTAVLVEIAREEHGHTPEVSYGTHFFLDLVEEQIIYAAVYPDKEESEFNEDFFEKARNILAELLPDEADFERVIKVIDVSAESGGAYASVVVDQLTQNALCYLKIDPVFFP